MLHLIRLNLSLRLFAINWSPIEKNDKHVKIVNVLKVGTPLAVAPVLIVDFTSAYFGLSFVRLFRIYNCTLAILLLR